MWQKRGLAHYFETQKLLLTYSRCDDNTENTETETNSTHGITGWQTSSVMSSLSNGFRLECEGEICALKACSTNFQYWPVMGFSSHCVSLVTSTLLKAWFNLLVSWNLREQKLYWPDPALFWFLLTKILNDCFQFTTRNTQHVSLYITAHGAKKYAAKILPKRHLFALPPKICPVPSGSNPLSCSLTQIFEIPLMHNRLNMTEREAKITRE